MNGTITVLVHGSSLKVTERVMEFKGMGGGLEMADLILSVLLLKGPRGGAQDASTRAYFWEVAVGFGRALTREFSSNSLVSWSKQKIEEDFSRVYHIRAGPHRVVGNPWHIRASDIPYNGIWALKAAICSVGSELPLYASNIESRKFSGIGLS
ncbi:hypothetical protein B296_00003260 [Ensete ventricosum]|uniref:Uncharacterized protein n=1 Tax=Ensete ventricosum TaxID=4639 RepID=A0A427AG16_ENSVE|nr:hypothetical protein B296_00003260 [Ensete ventricosum]